MLRKHLLTRTFILTINLSPKRTAIHPTVSAMEFIQGKSAVGKPVSFKPVRVELEKGKSYSYCACGGSSKQPFCDGSHKRLNTELKEDVEKYSPLRFVCEETRSVLLCNCKASSNRPFCDGTHKTIKPKDKAI